MVSALMWDESKVGKDKGSRDIYQSTFKVASKGFADITELASMAKLVIPSALE